MSAHELASPGRTSALKGQITKLKNSIAKLEKENWNLMFRVDKLEGLLNEYGIDYEYELSLDEEDEEDDPVGAKSQQELDRDIHKR